MDIATGLTHAALLLQQQIAAANKGIYEAAQARPECAGMGTTIVAAVFYGNRVSIAHIGDSRCYRLRGEKFEQLTRDHSLLQEQIDSGQLTPEQARFSLNKNLVTRALGIEAIVPADISEYRVGAGRHLPAVLRRTDRHGRHRGRARRSSTSSATTSQWRRASCRARQPERRARQHLGDPGPRAGRSSCRTTVGAALAREEARELRLSAHGQARALHGRRHDARRSRSTASASRSAAAPDNDVCLPYPAVSGEHAEIVTILADSFLDDLGSTNGTLVNGAASPSISCATATRSTSAGSLVYLDDEAATLEAPRAGAVGRRETARSADCDIAFGRRAPREAPVGLRRAGAGFRHPGCRNPVRTAPSLAPNRRRVCLAGAPLPGTDGAAPAPRRVERLTDVEPALKVVSGAKAGRIVALVKDETLIGRAGVQVVALRRTPDEVRVVPIEGAQPAARQWDTGGAGRSVARDRRRPGNRRNEARAHCAHEATFGLMPY